MTQLMNPADTRSQNYFNISGVDPQPDCKNVYIWCRAENDAEYTLIEKGFSVKGNDIRPQGIAAGQFSITFAVPAHCSAADIIVTSDAHAHQRLVDVQITPCT